MISHSHKFIFIQINRCASSSVGRALIKCNPRSSGHGHLSSYPPEKIKSHFTFSFVRNPWDKLVSQYFWNGPGAKDGMRGVGVPSHTFPPDKQITFSEYVKDYVNKGMRISSAWPLQLLPFISDGGKVAIDFIGRFENLQEDFNIVCDKIGIPHQQLPHRNKTKHTHYTEYYDDEAREIVAEKYAKDIQCFGYKFGK